MGANLVKKSVCSADACVWGGGVNNNNKQHLNGPYPSPHHSNNTPLPQIKTRPTQKKRKGKKMGIIAKSKQLNTTTAATNNHHNENRGMGLLLVFFPEDNNNNNNNNNNPTTSPISSTPNSSSSSSRKTIRRTNSNNPILTKTQSTISICVLFLFLTLLLFSLSTFEPTIPNPTTISQTSPRRFLSQKLSPNLKNPSPIKTPNSNSSWFNRMWPNKPTKGSEIYALQGMGKLYRRGTRAMTDLVVAHLVEDTNGDEFRLFLRFLHRSGLTAKSDVVFVFGSSSIASRFHNLIQEENDSFLKLVRRRSTDSNLTSHDSGFDVTQFVVKNGKKEFGEPLWGKKIRVSSSSSSNVSEESQGELTRLSYGSVVGFEATELDPENSLAGFLDHVPMSLRRWACYPMLLGRVRRNFKHAMLVDVKNLVLLGDPLGRVRNRSPESVYISTRLETSSSKHSKKNSDKTQPHRQVDSGILMGGARGIRRLSSAMLTEIVRAAMLQHKKKNLVTESGILSQLVSNGHVLKNIDLIMSSESIPGTRAMIIGSQSSL